MRPISSLREFARSPWLAFAALALAAGPAAAQTSPNSRAPGWDALRKCELVVAGRYKSHMGDKLSLEVLEVLHGKTCKVGDLLSVKLGQAITLLVSPPPATPSKTESAARPYLWERDASLRLIPPVHDLARPLVYFFPQETTPRLEQTRQIQQDRRDGWKQALAGDRRGLSFRLSLDRESALFGEAVAEFFKTRHAAAVAAQLAILLEPSSRGGRARDQDLAERLLHALGDRKGDLYEPTRKALFGIKPTDSVGEWQQTRLARILARADSKRAYRDFSTLLKGNSPGRHSALVLALPHLYSEEGMNLLVACLRDPALAETAMNALTGLMYPTSHLDKTMPSVRWARTQDLAVPRIEKALANREIHGMSYHRAMGYGAFHCLAKEPASDAFSPCYPALHTGTVPPLKTLPPRVDYPGQEVSDEVERALGKDIVSGRKLLAATLARKAQLPPGEKGQLVWLSSLYGDPESPPQGTQPEERAVRFRNPHANPAYQREPLSLFLKKLDATPRTTGSYGQIEEMFSARLLALYPNHLDEFFKRVAALIVSESASEREFGISCLESHFAWRFDLDAADPVPLLARKLEELRPLFARMSRGSLLEARGSLLGHFGVKLEGPPGKRWLPALEKAALSWNPTLCLNALRVLSMLVGDPDLMRYAFRPLRKRGVELKAHLASGIIYQAPNFGREVKPLSPARLQALWRDLTSEEEAMAFRAMHELVSAPASALAFFRKNLTVPPVPEARRCVRLIADLDSRAFKVRDQASVELKKLGEGVVPYLRRELEKPVALEVRRRMEDLLRFFAAGRTGIVRALQVLENLPGTAAWDFLDELTAGPADASLTREARGALRRVKHYWQW